MSDLDVRQISLLAELARLRSVSAASHSVGLSQSAASHALAKLRKQLGDPLFTRTSHGIEPTPYGERLGIAASEALNALRAGIASNRPFDPSTTTRRFNFYMSDVGQMVMLPALLAYLAKEAPGATVRTWPVPLENAGAGLASGEVDLAVGYFTNLTSGFLQSVLFREHYVCVVRANHPRFRNGMSVEAFAATQHAIADATGMAHAIIDRYLARNRIRRADTLRVPAFSVLPMIAAKTDLLAIIPSRLADAFAAHARVRILPTPVPIPAFDISMFWHARYHHDPTIGWLRKVLVHLFRGKTLSI